MEQQNTKSETEIDPQTIQTKIKVFKILVVVTALVCVIMVIFILSKTSTFFGSLFILGTEIPSKNYLKQYYKAYIATIYFSIFGFVICISNTILFFYKFTQKDKVLIFHIIYFLIFFISGIVALADSDYKNYMTNLSTLSLLSPACSTGVYIFECLLASLYLTYRSQVVTFFVIFCIFFICYTGIYHYSVLKLLPFQIEEPKKQQQRKESIFNNKNETFVSEMFDEYVN